MTSTVQADQPVMGTGIKRVDSLPRPMCILRDGKPSLYNEGDTPDLEDTNPRSGRSARSAL